MGYRFRLHRPDLPGTPDLTLPKYRTVVFVHGCFWHQHKGCKAADRPASNRDYWDAKLDRTLARDAANRERLIAQGWRVLTVWECQLKQPDRVAMRLDRTLRARWANQQSRKLTT